MTCTLSVQVPLSALLGLFFADRNVDPFLFSLCCDTLGSGTHEVHDLLQLTSQEGRQLIFLKTRILFNMFFFSFPEAISVCAPQSLGAFRSAFERCGSIRFRELNHF